MSMFFCQVIPPDLKVLEASMLKKFLLATVCVAGLSVVGPFSAAYADTAPTLTVDQQAALDAQVAAVEALVIQYQNDPVGLQSAIQSLVENASDPAVAGQAVVSVFNSSTNPAIQTILANNPGIKDAGGQGLGAAIAAIGVTNPDIAIQMTAYVQANGGSTFMSSVQSGSDTQTASIQQQQQQNSTNNYNNLSNTSTPETPASSS